MVYTEPRDQLSWKDIELFCQRRIAEGAHLDYKERFPRNLEKTIAAMANTLGGIILIGVEEDDENKPKMPLKGIPFKRGLEEKVVSIDLDSITPPVFPEVVPVLETSGEKAIVVIRVPQSDRTPHAIASNTRVYLRTGNRNKPESLATTDEIEWLRDKRRKSEELRERLCKRANDRSITLYRQQIEELKARKPEAKPSSLAWLTLSLCPLYPKDFLKTPPEMSEVYGAIKIHDYCGTYDFFPPHDLNRSTRTGRIVQDGIVLINRYLAEKCFFHTELNCFGLYFYKQNLPWRESQHDKRPSTSFLASEILTRLGEFFNTAIKYYEIMGYWGLLQFRVELSNIHQCGLSLDWLYGPDSSSPNLSPDPEVQLTETVPAGELRTEKRRLILQSVQRVTWAFGWNVIQEDVDRFYKSYMSLD